MLAKQENNNVLGDTPLSLPEQVGFYLRDEKNYRLIPEKDIVVKITPSLKNTVDKSNLFNEEDKKNFVFE